MSLGLSKEEMDLLFQTKCKENYSKFELAKDVQIKALIVRGLSKNEANNLVESNLRLNAYSYALLDVVNVNNQRIQTQLVQHGIDI